MTQFDEKLKELSKDMKIPDTYSRRVSETLDALPEQTQKKSKRTGRRPVYRVAVCCVIIIVILSLGAIGVNANIFDDFKQTLMNYFHIGTESTPGELGVETKTEEAVSQPDLFLELKETVVGSHNIYLLFQITAPKNISFADNITFDYFAFCRGENYSADEIISGVSDCSLMEIKSGKENEALYVMTISSDEKIPEGERVTAYFKDLMIDPFGDAPEMLVEGMWKLTFTADYTVTDEISCTDIEDGAFPYINDTAYVKEINITPLGMTVVSDVTNIPGDVLGVSDTSIRIRLKLVDGSELLIMSHDFEEELATESGSFMYDIVDDVAYQTNQFEFKEVMALETILGVYVEDTYIPIVDYGD